MATGGVGNSKVSKKAAANSNNHVATSKVVGSNGVNTKYVGSLSLITFAVLAICWITGFLSRLFSVIRFESIIHEFDPW